MLDRYTKLGFSVSELPAEYEIAIMRLTLMAQGFETQIPKSFLELPPEHRILLAEELARTGCKDQFERAPSNMKSAGPAILIYYAPAILQKAQARECYEAL